MTTLAVALHLPSVAVCGALILCGGGWVGTGPASSATIPCTWDEGFKSTFVTLKDDKKTACFRESTTINCNAGVRATAKLTSGIYKWTVRVGHPCIDGGDCVRPFYPSPVRDT